MIECSLNRRLWSPRTVNGSDLDHITNVLAPGDDLISSGLYRNRGLGHQFTVVGVSKYNSPFRGRAYSVEFHTNQSPSA
jgi:hypothetical protein